MACGDVSAEVLGTQGATYAIKEKNALSLIEARLKQLQDSGAIERAEVLLKEQGIRSIESPKPVSGLRETDKPRRFEKDLTVVVAKDIRGANGEVIHKAGTRINPLEKTFSEKTLLFFDGDNPKHLKWAIQAYEQNQGLCKMVLVKGSPLALMREHDLPFYFDQKGRLVGYFGIAQIPAKVFQDQSKLWIEELRL